ncbi:MAG TPA: lytic transglycosylase domain-containing protein [Thermoanaerobaculia bacterium]|nr:lytic transglycosylase domain-containing protein [Thermoanaerobaculia bacterium]
MSELKTSRPFQERFLDGFERSRLREEVQKVKPQRLSGLRRKYAGWALGASLALGGIGIPLRVSNMLQSADANAPQTPRAPDTSAQIADDLKTASHIADQVSSGITGGVAGAVQDVEATVASAPAQVAQAPQTLVSVAEQAKQRFFQREIPFGSIIYDEAMKNNLSPELLAAVVNTESKFVPTARSTRGAVGLMQLVPSTGRWLGADNLNDPAQNIQAGAKYLRYLTDRFAGDQQKAIAAYNAGEGNVRRFNGVPPFSETRSYVQRVHTFQHDLGVRIDGEGSEAVGASQ